MHQTTAAIHAMFLALALLASQSWGYFAMPQLEEMAVVQQSDIEQEEGSAILELSVPTAPEKGPEVRTASPKTPKDSSKSSVWADWLAPNYQWTTHVHLSWAAVVYGIYSPPITSSGHPYSYGNKGPPQLAA
ncbi:MAG: hypothetical protein AB8E82_02685 [Aureispira sp.]